MPPPRSLSLPGLGRLARLLGYRLLGYRLLGYRLLHDTRITTVLLQYQRDYDLRPDVTTYSTYCTRVRSIKVYRPRL